MKFYFFLLSIIVFGSCSKDDSLETGTGSFELTISGEKTIWETNYAYEGPAFGLSILSHPTPVDFDEDKFEYIWFRIHDFDLSTLSDYKLFYPTSEVYFYDGGECEPCFMASGTLEITKDDSSYNIIYELTGVDSQQISGSYTGKISSID